ncbi:MAG: peptidase M15 [Ignavibacteriae bacterium]|nr:peptidase M15 [Ignavibacteriota bacterium]
MSKFKNLKYFKRSEFDSPDLKNSGVLMSSEILNMLDNARELANIPFIITSGYRTAFHNKKIGGVKNSSHLRGLAVDIKADNSRDRFLIVCALLQVGFARIGIKDNIIHCDIDSKKDANVIWLYPK